MNNASKVNLLLLGQQIGVGAGGAAGPEQGIAGPATVPMEFLSGATSALVRGVPGEPAWLTLRSLRGAWELAGGAEVFVCESPTVPGAAVDRHSAASRPLVCTFGLSSQATWELLMGLGEVHCQARADGDVAGWRAVKQLRARLPGAFTWRMPEGCTAYEEGLLEGLLSGLKGDTLGP